jgi:hypothetical protein
MLEPAS